MDDYLQELYEEVMGDGFALQAGWETIMDTREADDHMMAKYMKSSSQGDKLAAYQGIKGGGGSATLNPKQLSPAEVAALPLVSKLNHEDGTVTLEFINIPNDQARRIVETILPNVMELYLNKSRDYGGNVMSMLRLGPKASFVDLWRKVGKLKRALWDGEDMVGEQANEILADCVGHILITLDEMRSHG